MATERPEKSGISWPLGGESLNTLNIFQNAISVATDEHGIK